MAGRGPGRTRAGMTRTQQLRQAKSAAIVKEPAGGGAESARPTRSGAPTCKAPRQNLAKLGPKPTSPKVLDFKKPGMTKAMMARMKKAQEMQQKHKKVAEEEAARAGRPRTTAAPICGDARLGHEKRRSAPGPSTAPGPSRRPGRSRTPGPSRAPDPYMEPEPPAAYSKSGKPGKRSKPRSRTPAPEVPPETRKLANDTNAEIVVAQPMGPHVVSDVILPPGTIKAGRTTVVHIPQPEPASAPSRAGMGAVDLANKSMQVINETLDEQDVAEAAEVQNRLTELQQARREFVMAVANVSGNAIAINDDDDLDESLGLIPDESLEDPFAGFTGPVDLPPPRMPSPPSSPPRYLKTVPDIDEDQFRIQYSREHPDVVAARQFYEQREQREAERRRMLEQAREAQRSERCREEEFLRAASTARHDLLRMELPLEDEVLDDLVCDDEDADDLDNYNVAPCSPRATSPARRFPSPMADSRTAMSPIGECRMVSPARDRRMSPMQERRTPVAAPGSLDDLEAFCDFRRNPPKRAPPRGREQLHPDLWDLEDPWCSQTCPAYPEDRDLIQFSYEDLIQFD